MTQFPPGKLGGVMLLGWPSPYRLREGTLKTPVIDPVGECFCVHPEYLRPICKATGFPVKGYKAISSRVTCLLFACSPYAIILGVWTTVVYSLNTVLRRWSRAHVLVESSKISPPSIANHDSTTAVVFVANTGAIVAPRVHPFPDAVLRQGGLSVCSVPLASRLVMQATAALAATSFQGSGTNRCNLPAITSAFPESAIILRFPSVLQDFQPSKSAPCQVLKVRCSRHRMLFSHDRTPFTGLVRPAGRAYAPGGCSLL